MENTSNGLNEIYGKFSNLNERYEFLVKELRKMLKSVEQVKEPDVLLKRSLYEILKERVVRLLREMEGKGAPTLYRGLAGLYPDDIETDEELIEALVEYHGLEKLAIRKYRSATKKELKEQDIDTLFGVVLARTKNHADIIGKE